MSGDHPRYHPLWALTDNELDLILRLVLASGSLKDLASSYGVSYPTIRARLDQVIKRIQDLMANKPGDEMTAMLADFVAKGEITPLAAQSVVERHRTLLAQGKTLPRVVNSSD